MKPGKTVRAGPYHRLAGLDLERQRRLSHRLGGCIGRMADRRAKWALGRQRQRASEQRALDGKKGGEDGVHRSRE